MQIRHDREFGRNYFLYNAIGAMAILIAFGVSFWAIMWSRILGLICFGLTACCFAGYVAIEQWMIRSYHCKNCGLKLNKDEDPEDRQIFYDCVECDTKWKVGLYRPES